MLILRKKTGNADKLFRNSTFINMGEKESKLQRTFRKRSDNVIL